jgi:uncharacterized protein YpmS
MRNVKAILVLFVFAVSIFSPLVPHLSLVSQGAVLVTLDVCSAGAHSLSTNSDMQYLFENQYVFPYFVNTDAYRVFNPAFKPLLIAFQKERPPRV